MVTNNKLIRYYEHLRDQRKREIDNLEFDHTSLLFAFSKLLYLKKMEEARKLEQRIRENYDKLCKAYFRFHALEDDIIAIKRLEVLHNGK